MSRTGGSALLGGKFSDPASARDAFDTLIGTGTHQAKDLNVIFSGSNGEYLILIAAKSHRAEAWAIQVLRDRGANMQVESYLRRILGLRNHAAHGDSGADRQSPDERALLSRWASLATVLIEQGLVEPIDLLALVIAAQESATDEPQDDRRSRLQEADSELREVSAKLQDALRARRPELFDRAGRLRTAELTRHLTALAGDKRHLPGDDLLALESAADEEAALPSSSAT